MSSNYYLQFYCFYSRISEDTRESMEVCILKKKKTKKKLHGLLFIEFQVLNKELINSCLVKSSTHLVYLFFLLLLLLFFFNRLKCSTLLSYMYMYWMPSYYKIINIINNWVCVYLHLAIMICFFFFIFRFFVFSYLHNVDEDGKF